MKKRKKPPPQKGEPRISQRDAVALDMIEGVGRASLKLIVESGLSVEQLAGLSDDELKVYVKGARAKAAVYVIRSDFDVYRDRAERRIEDWSNSGVKLTTRWDRDYPRTLLQISTPPTFLFYRGNRPLLDKLESVAIVGTRDSSNAGEEIASKTASFFAERGFNIVSGLAIGIDTSAHKGALLAKGETTAVLVDVSKIYPHENLNLAERILDENGLLVAENPPGSFSHRGLLVERDRIQSGLSVAVFPIETDVKGGTMHTVRFAREQKKLLFCPDLDRWPNTTRFNKPAGIRKLLSNGWADPFSPDSYDELLIRIQNATVPTPGSIVDPQLGLGI